MKRFLSLSYSIRTDFPEGFGTGIGLALARSLAELHEGNLIMDDSLKAELFYSFIASKA